MRYGFVVPKGDPHTVADLAREAEEAGWDGVFYWDGIWVGEMETYDPWVVMAAMAMRTEQIHLGAMLTPPARRRPWKLARDGDPGPPLGRAPGPAGGARRRGRRWLRQGRGAYGSQD